MAGKTLDKAIEAAELQKRLTAHSLLHTFASLLLADGIPALEVAHHLGHKDCSVTLKVYAPFIRQENRTIHNLAARILAAGQA